ncbi:type II secretion system protein XpsI [Lysobacter sp. A289]
MPRRAEHRRVVRGGCGRRQRGYTLIEVIVAFALLAVALTLLLGTLSGATSQVRWSGDAGRAALHAQSLLDTVGVVAPVQPGQRHGEFDDGRYRWSLQVAVWRDPALAKMPVALSAPQLLEVVLDVTWGDGGPRERLQMRTLRLVATEPADGWP